MYVLSLLSDVSTLILRLVGCNSVCKDCTATFGGTRASLSKYRAGLFERTAHRLVDRRCHLASPAYPGRPRIGCASRIGAASEFAGTHDWKGDGRYLAIVSTLPTCERLDRPHVSTTTRARSVQCWRDLGTWSVFFSSSDTTTLTLAQPSSISSWTSLLLSEYLKLKNLPLTILELRNWSIRFYSCVSSQLLKYSRLTRSPFAAASCFHRRRNNCRTESSFDCCFEYL